MMSVRALALALVVGAVLAAEADSATKTAEKSGEQKYSGTWFEGFLSSWFMILVSEIGDKTFFIACLMAMRNSRTIVFCGAMGALATMTILSAMIGNIVPSLLPVHYTQTAAVVLFTGFGVKLLYEAKDMDDNPEEEPEELTEAQAELTKKEDEYGDDVTIDMSPNSRAEAAKKPATGGTLLRSISSIFGPVFVQAFTLTFVAEWGDRSQLATIALAAAKNPYGVTLGGIVGHSVCTGSAVMIGRKVATTFTARHVTIFGGVLFIIFGVLTAYQLMYVPPEQIPQHP